MARPSKYYEIEDQIATVIADLELYSYYQILEVHPDSTADVILYTYNLKSYEYEQLQKDRFCGAVLHHNLKLLRERLDEARQVLADPVLRREYDQGLELGEMRHAATAAQRQAAPLGEGPKDALIDHLAGKLERTIHREYLDAGEELLPDEPSMGIDPELVEQEKIRLEEQVAKLGVELEVKADEDPLAAAPMDGTFLDDATRHLTAKLYVEHNLSIHDRGEAEDVAADAQFAGTLTEGLRGELYKMGISEWEAPKEIERPIDVEFLDGLVAQEQRALVALGVTAAVRADEEVRPIDALDAGQLAAGLESELEQLEIRYAAERPAAGLASLVEGLTGDESAPTPPVVLIPLPQVAEDGAPFEDAILIDDVLIDAPAAPLPPSPRPPTGPVRPQSVTPVEAAPPPTGPLPQRQTIDPQPPPHSATGPLPQAASRQPMGQQPPARHARGSPPPLGITNLERPSLVARPAQLATPGPEPSRDRSADGDVGILVPLDEEPSEPTKE
jgi:hypothetical protein